MPGIDLIYDYFTDPYLSVLLQENIEEVFTNA